MVFRKHSVVHKTINYSQIYTKHPHWCNTQMYNNGLNHQQLTLLWMFITWQLDMTSSISHHQTTVEEHECCFQVLVWVDKCLLSTNSLYMKHPHWCNTQKYDDGFNHTQFTFCECLLPVSTSSTSHQQAMWKNMITYTWVKTSFQIINICKWVSCVWLKLSLHI